MMTFRSKINTWLIAVLLSLCVAAQVQATNMYAILVADTEVSDIGYSVALDLAHMEQETRVISMYTGMRLHQKIFAGPRFVREDILSYVESLQVKEDDVILFFYAGHGFRIKNMDTRWPALFFGWDVGGLDLAEVADIIEAKNPRMALVMADCCNNEIPGIPNLDFSKMSSARGIFSSSDKGGYKELFKEFRGIIITTAAEEGAFSLGNDRKGGFYTHSFLESLHKEVKKTSPVWEHLLLKAQGGVEDYERTVFEIYQS